MSTDPTLRTNVRLKISQKNSTLIVQALILSVLFFIPISISFKAIVLIASVLAILIFPYYRQQIVYACNTLLGRATLLLFLCFALGCLYSPASWAMQWSSLSKYLKLLYLPILSVAFLDKKLRNRAINTYLIAMLITCSISIAKAWGLVASKDAGAVFFNHIVTGLMMAYAAYLAGVYAFEKQGILRYLYVAMVVLTSYQILFINIGRTGYLVYVLLMGLLLIQNLSWKKAGLALLLFIGILGLVYTQSQYLQMRVHESIYEVKSFKTNKDTSIGFRLQFHQYAQSLFESHPIFGVGTGGFKYRFTQDNPVPSWGTAIADPHSQYWMILAEQGLVGILLLVSFLGALLITSYKLQETRPILWGMLIVFCIGSLTDTILCFSPVGYLLIAISALCLGELVQLRQLDNSKLRVYLFTNFLESW